MRMSKNSHWFHLIISQMFTFALSLIPFFGCWSHNYTFMEIFSSFPLCFCIMKIQNSLFWSDCTFIQFMLIEFTCTTLLLVIISDCQIILSIFIYLKLWFWRSRWLRLTLKRFQLMNITSINSRHQHTWFLFHPAFCFIFIIINCTCFKILHIIPILIKFNSFKNLAEAQIIINSF